MSQFIIALDQGTTSSRALVFNEKGSICALAQKEFTQHFPKAGWVEHDPAELLASQLSVLDEAVRTAGIKVEEIQAIGITNQRETTVLWDRTTGKAVYPAIVWQDKRTASICEELKARGLEGHVRKTTGLVIDSYFSATKVKWILDHVEGVREKAMRGDVLFGTVDSWLIWNLTGGESHCTDFSNASRTMLFDIRNLQWDDTLLKELDIPRAILPKVLPSSGEFGHWTFQGKRIPIAGVAGDQQAALFGQACFEPGMTKNTYGTGCFLLMNTGAKLQYSERGLITTIAWGLEGKVEYALEGSVFIAGAAIQWLRDGLQIIAHSNDSEALAKSVEGPSDVYMVPAFAGLGAPYWDMYARGAIFGLTRDTGKNHLVKATLESLAYQTKDILMAMEKDAGIKLPVLKVDGGACANNFLMQFQADILGTPVERPALVESTAIGAAYLAGIGVGIWTKRDIVKNRQVEKTFVPSIAEHQRSNLYAGWQKAVERTKGWADNRNA